MISPQGNREMIQESTHHTTRLPQKQDRLHGQLKSNRVKLVVDWIIAQIFTTPTPIGRV